MVASVFALLASIGSSTSQITLISYGQGGQDAGIDVIQPNYPVRLRWSQSISHSNVSISVGLASLGSHGTGWAVVTSGEGHVAFTNFDYPTGFGRVDLFEGLDLQPGTYDLTIGAFSGDDVGWGVTAAGTIYTADDVSYLGTFTYSGPSLPVDVLIVNYAGTSTTINCSAPLVLECTDGGAVATIEAELKDSSGNAVRTVLSVDGRPYETYTMPLGGALTPMVLRFTARFALGDHLVTISADNGKTPPATCSAKVTVRDTIPPQILSLTATPDLLWPPNHRMVPVTIAVQATDNCGPATSKIVAVTSNEPRSSLQGGPDWLITGDLSVDLRAARFVNGQERSYEIFVESKDAAGNSSLRSVTVAVPHDKGGERRP